MGSSNTFVYTHKILANFRKFYHLHLHHCVRLPHHSLENSRTFQDLSLKFPRFFQDFPGPGHFTKKNPGLSSRHGNPDSMHPVNMISASLSTIQLKLQLRELSDSHAHTHTSYLLYATFLKLWDLGFKEQK